MSGKKRCAERLLIYSIGIFLVSLGIVLCRQCGLGISPISTIPFVLEEALPLSFGTLTMCFHLVNIFLQMLLKRDPKDTRILLQIPVAVLFGQVINLLQKAVGPAGENWLLQYSFLILSIIFTALGMVLMMKMNLVQNPPDGFVKELGIRMKKELGGVKRGYDVALILVTAVIGLGLYGELRGIGVATVVSALAVGSLVRWFNQWIISE